MIERIKMTDFKKEFKEIESEISGSKDLVALLAFVSAVADKQKEIIELINFQDRIQISIPRMTDVEREIGLRHSFYHGYFACADDFVDETRDTIREASRKAYS